MFECDCLYEDNYINKKKRILVKLQRHGVVRIHLKNNVLDGSAIAYLASELNYVIKTYKKACKKIIISCNELKPGDKLSYILLEIILYDLFINKGYEVELQGNTCRTSIDTEGLYDSTINNHYEYTLDPTKYIKKFEFEQNGTHFRRIIKKENSGGATISVLLGELKTFFYTSGIDKKETDRLAQVISELVDNTGEHTNADCLIDVDISKEPYTVASEENQEFRAVNTVVLNLGDKCLGDDIQNKIKNHFYTDSDRYNMVECAYNNHKGLFGKYYNEIDFFTVVAFQDAISGRKDETKTGGTGLTQLIKSLESNAYEHGCYVLSGRQGLFFWPEFLEYNQENWLGFNRNKNFISEPPDDKVILRTNTFLRGTGYNFTLIYKKGAQ